MGLPKYFLLLLLLIIPFAYAQDIIQMNISSNTILNGSDYNISQGILFLNDDLTLDCNHSNIYGTNDYMGITLTSRNNIIIKNCNLINYKVAFLLNNSNNVSLLDNTGESNDFVNDPYWGVVQVNNGGNHIIRNNSLKINEDRPDRGFGIYVSSSDNNLVENNIISSNFWIASGIYLNNADSNQILNNSVDNLGIVQGIGFDFVNGNNNLFMNNHAENNSKGFYFQFCFSSNSEGNNITNNTILNNNIGFYLYDSNCNPSFQIKNNNIYNNSEYNIANYLNENISILNTWFGTINEQEIDSKIYDFYDNPSYGIVNYSTFSLGFHGSCTPNWVINESSFGSCTSQDVIQGEEYDTNLCTSETQEVNNSCDYCIPNWELIEEDVCYDGDYKIGFYNDSNMCYSLTNLEVDLEGKPSNITYNFSCDFDGDGFIGNLSDINSSIGNLSLSNINQKIYINTTNSSLLFFDWNLSLSPLNLGNLSIVKQNASQSFAYMLIKGLNLSTQNKTKTIYLNRILNGTGICIKDSEVNFISDISSGCNGDEEFWIACPGINGNYTCNISSNNTEYVISGLSHSGAIEQSTHCGDGICNGVETCSLCQTDCGICSTSSSSGGSSGGTTKGDSLVINNKSNFSENIIDSMDLNNTNNDSSTREKTEEGEDVVMKNNITDDILHILVLLAIISIFILTYKNRKSLSKKYPPRIFKRKLKSM